MLNKSLWFLLASCLSSGSRAESVVLAEQLVNSLMKQLLGHWDIKDASKDPQGQ